jgi:pyruvate dehydrogenase E2 component (dihydrolipoamide acetyltransferase)
LFRGGGIDVPTDFTLPELGENIEGGDVLRVLVQSGDSIAQDQPVLELETDKATVEVPSSVVGQVTAVKVKAGDRVKVGQAILTVEAGEVQTARPAAAQEPSSEQIEPVVVEADKPPKAAASSQVDDVPQARGQKVVDISRASRQPVTEGATVVRDTGMAPAAPSVRRIARELGVDINQVQGNGPHGRISIDDVKAHAKRIVSGAAQIRPRGTLVPAEPLPDFARWGAIDRQPMRAVRRKIAEHLAAAWASVAHVTQHDVADITQLEDFRRRYAKQVDAAGGHLTVTAVAAKVVASALKVFPQFNVSLDLAADEIVYKKYVNIGIAVDTDRGLLVPVLRNVDSKNVIELSVELAQLSERARSRKISLEEMQGGCFSISNLGGIGGSFFTPIVNAPEVAVLGISRAKMEPIYDKTTGQFVPRMMLPLSLSYDHRVIDGADGIRFLRWVAEALEQPFLLALQG